ncbi:hypothetical protein ASF89_12315 [Frigoribacterium sp. Leaf172]|nr:hypothetical protein ASF89_12315 [Frigoribacterium sp. Leaf172]
MSATATQCWASFGVSAVGVDVEDETALHRALADVAERVGDDLPDLPDALPARDRRDRVGVLVGTAAQHGGRLLTRSSFAHELDRTGHH